MISTMEIYVGFKIMWDSVPESAVTEIDDNMCKVTFREQPPKGWKLAHYRSLGYPKDRSRWEFYLHLDLHDRNVQTLTKWLHEDVSLMRRGKLHARILGVPDDVQMQMLPVENTE
jgi:hypothetical protein